MPWDIWGSRLVMKIVTSLVPGCVVLCFLPTCSWRVHEICRDIAGMLDMQNPVQKVSCPSNRNRSGHGTLFEGTWNQRNTLGVRTQKILQLTKNCVQTCNIDKKEHMLLQNPVTCSILFWLGSLTPQGFKIPEVELGNDCSGPEISLEFLFLGNFRAYEEETHVNAMQMLHIFFEYSIDSSIIIETYHCTSLTSIPSFTSLLN